MVCASHVSNRLWWTLAMVALFAAVLQGCANFKEVSTFASLSAKGAGYDAVMQDYIGAVDRRKQYQPQKFQAELAGLKVSREAQSAALDLLQRTITGYMQGLDRSRLGQYQKL